MAFGLLNAQAAESGRVTLLPSVPGRPRTRTPSGSGRHDVYLHPEADREPSRFAGCRSPLKGASAWSAFDAFGPSSSPRSPCRGCSWVAASRRRPRRPRRHHRRLRSRHPAPRAQRCRASFSKPRPKGDGSRCQGLRCRPSRRTRPPVEAVRSERFLNHLLPAGS